MDNIYNILVNFSSTVKTVKMHKLVRRLTPYAVYAFFVEMYVLDGDVRKSGIVTLRMPESGKDVAFL